MNRPLLALDFDGVLCDSRPECAIVAANAWLSLGNAGHVPCFSAAVWPERTLDRFVRFRFLVRTAEQFVLLCDLAASDVAIDPLLPLESQTPADPGRMAVFRERFFALRGLWRETDMDSWLAQNPIHTAVAGCLGDLSRVPDLTIVSAKDETSIRAILDRAGLSLGPDRIFGNGQGDKRALMTGLLARHPGCPILFVDDNPDNLVLAGLPGVRGYLATWGYLGPDFVSRATEAGFDAIDAAGFSALIREAMA